MTEWKAGDRFEVREMHQWGDGPANNAGEVIGRHLEWISVHYDNGRETLRHPCALQRPNYKIGDSVTILRPENVGAPTSTRGLTGEVIRVGSVSVRYGKQLLQVKLPGESRLWYFTTDDVKRSGILHRGPITSRNALKVGDIVKDAFGDFALYDSAYDDDPEPWLTFGDDAYLPDSWVKYPVEIVGRERK